MILAKARVIGERNGSVRVGLSLPTGFDPEEVVQETVFGNGAVAPDGFHVEPRKGRMGDVFRELEVSFTESALSEVDGATPTLRITGKLRRGLQFTASVPLIAAAKKPSSDH